MEVQKIDKTKCKTCKYRTHMSGAGDESGMGNLACGYILDKHERRGCPVGAKCTKYEKGNSVRFKAY